MVGKCHPPTHARTANPSSMPNCLTTKARQYTRKKVATVQMDKKKMYTLMI